MKKESILVLDLGSANVKVVEAEIQSSKASIKHLSLNPLSLELQKTTSVTDPLYINFIKNIILKNKISATDAILCISNAHLELKNLVLPAMNDKELKVSVHWEIKDLINMSVDDAVIDYSVLQEFGQPQSKRMRLSVAALPKKISQEHVSLLDSLNLSPKAFFLEPQAAWNILKNMHEVHDRRTVALVDMGAEKTTVSVFDNGKLEVMRNMEISGKRFTENITTRVKKISGEALDVDQAESVKCKYGIALIEGQPEENINPPELFAALRPYLEDFVSELTRFFEYYKSEHEGKSVELIVLYGGGSKLKGLEDYISKNTGVTVLLPNSFKSGNFNFSVSGEEEIEKAGCFFVNALGCLNSSMKNINLIPEEVKEKVLIKKQIGKWIKTWVGLVACLAFVYVPVQLIGWYKQDNVSKLKKRYTDLSLQKSKLDSYNETVKDLNTKTVLCNKLLAEEPFWDDVLKELAGVLPGNVVINKITFALAGTSYGSSKLPFVFEGIVYMKGAKTEEGVTKFLQNLEKSKYFHKVKLEFSKEGKIGEEKILEFSIGCEIK
jgi:type IV pilus assembly protein PilM